MNRIIGPTETAEAADAESGQAITPVAYGPICRRG
jgi:hypothetical protein